MNKDQLLSLTLRQLRQEASKLLVPLYSRKTKAVLVDLILKYQEKSSQKINISSPEPKFEETIESNTPYISEEVKTKVVFLPRDPDWAYVFWQISDADREKAQSLGANNYVYDYSMHLVLKEPTLIKEHLERSLLIVIVLSGTYLSHLQIGTIKSN